MTIRFSSHLATAFCGLLVVAILGCAEPTDPAALPEVDPEEHPMPQLHQPIEIRYESADQIFEAMPQAQAAAAIHPVGPGVTEGFAYFEEVEGGLRVVVDVRGLEPGRRGIHVHEHGSCAPGPDGEPAGAAGGHFAPLGSPHGAPDDPEGQRHVGDFGNLEVADDGTARLTFVDEVATLTDQTGIVGRALVIHAEQDDLETQPTGDAGARVACGIIEAR